MKIAVLRPEPGNAETCERLMVLGHTPIPLPLFEVAPIAWTAPEGVFDALLFTSANAPRHAGPGLERYAGFPVLAVGAATAAAARAMGLNVARTGTRDAAALLDAPHGFTRLLHLGGVTTTVAVEGAIAASVPVYANRPCEVPLGAVRDLADALVLLHAPSAARRFAELADQAGLDRQQVVLAALSPAVAAAAGAGWREVRVAAAPNEAALLQLTAPACPPISEP